MTKEDKIQLVKELSQKLAVTDYFYVADASGMTAGQVNEFRGACFAKGVEYQVVKNTLIAKALDTLDADYSEFDGVLKGFSGIMFSPEAGNIPAKILKEFRKGQAKGAQKPLLKGASIQGELYIGDDQLETLSSLKSKNELIGEIVGLLQSPAKNVISALQSGGQKLSGILETLAEREEAA